MAQIFKAKTLVANSGKFAYEVSAPNLISNTGDQNIGGNKNFYTRPTVNGTGVLLSGEAVNLPATIVYITGDQNISGVKNFYSRPTVNGSGVLLIGETGSVALPNTLVYITGNQDISGVKNFNDRPTVNGIGVLLSGEVSTIISGVLYSAQINIKNDNGSKIYRGQPVYVSSAAGSNILVKLASNSGEQTSSKTLGLVYQDSLAQNAQGTIVTEGLLQGFNTNAGEEGDPIWLGPTGSLIFGLANKPYAPNHLVYLGVLTRKQANQGEIFVKIQNGFELEELHNVNINHRNALADKNIIRYDSLSGIWFNDTIDSVLPNSIVYTTGNQTISGSKTFDVAPIVSGNRLITGVDLNSYATTANLYATGSTLDNKINSLSGYVNSQDVIFSGQTFNTGSRLDNKINSLSGYVDSKDVILSGQIASTGSNLYNSIISLSGYVNSQSTSGQVFNTGSILDNKINSLSGYVNSQDTLFSGQTFNTGSRLDNKMNSLSGYVNSQDIIFSGQIALTGSILDNKINSLSGYVTGITGTFGTLPASLYATGSTLDNKINSLSGVSVLTFSDQNIYGNKTFFNNIEVSGTGIFQNINIINLNELVISGAKIIIGGNSGVYSYSNIYISGNQVLTGVDLSYYATNINLFTTGSALDDKINSLSGYVDYKDILISGQILSTGSILDNKINALSGYVTGITGTFGSLPTNLVLTGSTLDSKINSLSGYVNSQDVIFSGQTFNTGSRLDNKINSLSGYINAQDIIFSGQVFNTGSRLDGKINSLSGYVDSKSITLPSTIVYTTGNQTISGNKNFVENVIFGDQAQDNLLVISGNEISFGVYPTINGTGIVYTQGNQIISGNKTFDVFPVVSGSKLITGLDLSSYATNANLFATGSNLDNKINSLSGYVNSQTTSGQIFNTGSILDNKINSLSGYVNSQDIIFSGQTSNTGSRLDNKINSLSGYVNSQDILFSGQTFNTGSRLDSKINSLSGYLNSQDIIFSGQIALTGSNLYNSIVFLSGLFTGYTGSLDANFASDAQLFTTGSTLDNKINALSGYVNSQDIIFSGQTFNTGSKLDNKINALSGYIDSKSITLPSTIVYTTGDQFISGNKTFLNNVNVSGTGNFNNVKVSSIDKLFLSGIDMVITGNSSINVYNAIYISGNPVLTGVMPTAQTITDVVFTTGDQTIQGTKTFEVGNGDSKVIISGSKAFGYGLSVINNSNQGNVLFLKKGTNPGGGAVSENFVIKAVDRSDDLIFTLKSSQAGTNKAGFFCDPDGVNDAGGPNVSSDSVVISGRTYTIGESDNQLQYILSDSNSIQAVNPFYSYTGGLFFDNNGLNLKFVDKNGNYSALNPIEVTSGNDVFINGNSSFGIYQQGTLYPNGIPVDNSINKLTRLLNSLSFYYGIVSGTNFVSGLKPGNLLYYTTKNNANNNFGNSTKIRAKARPYMVVDEASNYNNSYTVNTSTINPGNAGNFSFLKFNKNSQYSGLAIKQLIFNPTIQNAYRSYNLWSGVNIEVKPKNIHLETFIDINVKSGNYWSIDNLGVTRYYNNITVRKPKSFNFTQSHILNFKLNFQTDSRVTRLANYPNRIVTIYNPDNIPTITITGYDYEFSQKLRLILNTDGSLREW